MHIQTRVIKILYKFQITINYEEERIIKEEEEEEEEEDLRGIYKHSWSCY